MPKGKVAGSSRTKMAAGSPKFSRELYENPKKIHISKDEKYF
jgi:hypothetical protein